MLTAIVVPIVIATLIGLVVLWPGKSSLVGSQPFGAEGTSLESATITSTSAEGCQEASKSLGDMADGGLLADAVCARITSGKGQGLVLPVHVPAESMSAADVGDEMRVMYTPRRSDVRHALCVRRLSAPGPRA